MFGPVLYGRFTPAQTGKAITVNDPTQSGPIPGDIPIFPPNTEPVTDAGTADQVEPGEPAAPDPTSSDAEPTQTVPAQSTDGAQSSTKDETDNLPAVHTFQVTHKVANPENPHSHSLIHSAELTVDEAIAWIRDRLLKS